MPAIAALPPLDLRKILEADGWKVQPEYEDEHNWLMIKDMKSAPIIIPKEGGEDGCVSFDVQEGVLADAQIDNFRFFALKQSVLGKPETIN